MVYSWVTPITDRTSSSKYNSSDVNRVANNVNYLEEYVTENIGHINSLAVYTTQDKTSLGGAELINLLEANINLMRDGLGYDPNTWITLSESWVGGGSFIYSDANNLEQNLLTLKTNFENIFRELRYCGTFEVGTTFRL